MLYGAHPDADRRPSGLRINITDVHSRKIKAVERMMRLASQSTDWELLAAYGAKIVKKSSTTKCVYNANNVRDTHKKMEAHVTRLESILEASRDPWVLGSRYTPADIMWTNSLYHLKWLGMGHFWEERSHRTRAQDDATQAFARPSFRRAVIHWPMAHPSTPANSRGSSLRRGASGR